MSGNKGIEETSEERALADIRDQAIAHRHAVYDPIINRHIAESKVSPEAAMRGTSNVETERAFAPAERRAVATDFARGVGPTRALTDMSLGKTQSKASGQVNAINAAKDVQLARTGSLLAYGRGEATHAVAGMGETGEAAQQQAARDAELASASRANIAGAVAGGAGLYAGLRNPSMTTSGKGKFTGTINPGLPSSAEAFGTRQAPVSLGMDSMPSSGLFYRG